MQKTKLALAVAALITALPLLQGCVPAVVTGANSVECCAPYGTMSSSGWKRNGMSSARSATSESRGTVG